MQLTLVILAAGAASRYGRLKQLEPVGPGGAALMDYAIHDALAAGFAKIVIVVAPGLESTFQEHAAQIFDGQVTPSLVTQDLVAVPEGIRVPDARQKPWGTAHAVLAAAHELTGPFAVVNADDFYGASSYRMLRDQLLAEPENATLVGFELHSTLSPHGGVSRGICELGGDGYLTGLTEVKQIECRKNSIVGFEVDGETVALRGDEIVSMNMWGFAPSVLETLRRQFSDFLKLQGADPSAEFLLSSAVAKQVNAETLRLRVLHSSEPWFGMTFAGDTPTVIATIAQLVANGDYPEHLWKGLP